MKDYPTINRNLVLVIGRKPFHDWANGLFPGLPHTSEETMKEHNSYLIEENTLFNDPEKALKKYWKPIFENELYGMCTDKAKWPTLTWELFTQWFTCHFSSVISDVTPKPLYQLHYE